MNARLLNMLRSTLAFLVIASALGLILRFAFVFELPEAIKYKNIQHAHSHGAMMGWLTACFYLFIWKIFELRSSVYGKLFWISQLLVLLMLVSFSWTGYSAISISLSVLFVFLNYIFVLYVLRDLSRSDGKTFSYSYRFLKAAVFFLAFSTIGIWAMGPIIAMSLKGSAWYYGAVQFYLHFQFNGWFIFGLLALLFRLLEKKNIELDAKMLRKFFILLLASCFPTYALSVSWSTPLSGIFWTNSIGVLLQGIGLVYFLLMIFKISDKARNQFRKSVFYLWGISFFCLSFKILIQTLVAIPVLAKVSYTIRYFIIGFIHLLMLGALSTFFFGMMRFFDLKVSRIGIQSFIIGLFLTESILFLQGLLIWMRLGFIPHYHLILALCSIPLLLGTVLILWRLKALDPA